MRLFFDLPPHGLNLILLVFYILFGLIDAFPVILHFLVVFKQVTSIFLVDLLDMVDPLQKQIFDIFEGGTGDRFRDVFSDVFEVA